MPPGTRCRQTGVDRRADDRDQDAPPPARSRRPSTSISVSAPSSWNHDRVEPSSGTRTLARGRARSGDSGVAHSGHQGCDTVSREDTGAHSGRPPDPQRGARGQRRITLAHNIFRRNRGDPPEQLVPSRRLARSLLQWLMRSGLHGHDLNARINLSFFLAGSHPPLFAGAGRPARPRAPAPFGPRRSAKWSLRASSRLHLTPDHRRPSPSRAA
jgi:hypothetical protein